MFVMLYMVAEHIAGWNHVVGAAPSQGCVVIYLIYRDGPDD